MQNDPPHIVFRKPVISDAADDLEADTDHAASGSEFPVLLSDPLRPFRGPARLSQLEQDLRAFVERSGNTLAAYIGELADRLEKTIIPPQDK